MVSATSTATTMNTAGHTRPIASMEEAIRFQRWHSRHSIRAFARTSGRFRREFASLRASSNFAWGFSLAVFELRALLVQLRSSLCKPLLRCGKLGVRPAAAVVCRSESCDQPWAMAFLPALTWPAWVSSSCFAAASRSARASSSPKRCARAALRWRQAAPLPLLR